MLGWLALFGIMLVAGYATSWPLIYLLSWRSDGRSEESRHALFKYQWLIVGILAAIYTICLGAAVDWKV